MDRSFSPLLLTTGLCLALSAARQMQAGAGAEPVLGGWAQPAAEAQVPELKADAWRTLEFAGRAEMAAACAGDLQGAAGLPPSLLLPSTAGACGQPS